MGESADVSSSWYRSEIQYWNVNFDHGEVWTRQSPLKSIYNKKFQYLHVKTMFIHGLLCCGWRLDSYLSDSQPSELTIAVKHSGTHPGWEPWKEHHAIMLSGLCRLLGFCRPKAQLPVIATPWYMASTTLVSVVRSLFKHNCSADRTQHERKVLPSVVLADQPTNPVSGKACSTTKGDLLLIKATFTRIANYRVSHLYNTSTHTPSTLHKRICT